jgi:catechol 2,3-dioxygenase-like lactoylglutathione lyase family enzyme
MLYRVWYGRKMKGIPGLQAIDHVGLTVPDLDEGVRFYVDVIGGEELFRMGPFDAAEIPPMPDGRDWTDAHVNVPGARLKIAVLRVGERTNLELFEYEKPAGANPTPPRNNDTGGHHIAFKVSSLDEATEYLRGRSVKLLEGPIEITEGPGAGQRVRYFLDPWGNQLELTEYDRLG